MNRISKEQAEQIAKVCHEANRAYCESIDDMSQPSWDDAPGWQISSAITGAYFHANNPNEGTSDSHDSWMQQKIDEGWVYGKTKEPEAKTHHCIVPYEQLPLEQRMKDYIFRGIVHSMIDGYDKS